MPATGRLRVTLAQFTAVADVRANLAQMLSLLEAAAGDGSDLVCFPELCLSGYQLDPASYPVAVLNELAGAESELEAAARKQGVQVLYGTARRTDGGLYNAVVLTEPDGSRTCYAKTHMVASERAVFAAGQELVLAASGDLAVGCCYDLAFPAFCADLAGAGARALFFPMAWEQQRSFVFEGVVAARAIENVAYVVCINQTGTCGMTKFHGGSKIIDPLGRTLVDMGDTAGVRTADLDLDWVTRLRSAADTATYPLLTDRRRQLPVRRGGPIEQALNEAVTNSLSGTLIP
ncbi:MAG TPA: carbon-nitrogen hydrolase family protein [Streptosporangiaceae bacterium]|nr:carbon-nitrogen hydrolase family protein [Streptosporangiaceae bacterium]